MKLGSLAFRLAFGGITDQEGQGTGVSGDLCNLRFKMDYNTHRWSDFILMPRVGTMGM